MSYAKKGWKIVRATVKGDTFGITYAYAGAPAPEPMAFDAASSLRGLNQVTHVTIRKPSDPDPDYGPHVLFPTEWAVSIATDTTMDLSAVELWLSIYTDDAAVTATEFQVEMALSSFLPNNYLRELYARKSVDVFDQFAVLKANHPLADGQREKLLGAGYVRVEEAIEQWAANEAPDGRRFVTRVVPFKGDGEA